MKFNARMREYCESLATNPEQPTDVLLRLYIDSQSLSKTVEEKFSQNETLAWDSLAHTIDEACAKIKEDLTPYGLYINGSSLLS